MRLTGSRYHLAVLCSYPFRPDVDVNERPSGEAAGLGSEVHSYVHAKYQGLNVAAMFFSDEAKVIGERVWQWLESRRPSAMEIKLVYNAVTDTARKVDLPGPRNYGPMRPEEIGVTLDMLWDAAIPSIMDLKTGKKEHAHEEQLIVQALAATRYLGRKQASVSFLWARKTKCERSPSVMLDAERLDMESWALASVLQNIPRARPMRGKHCWFCDHRPQCPAFQEPTEEERMTA